MKIKKRIVDIAYKYKSLLIRILPKKFLQGMKSNLIKLNTKDLDKMKFLPFDRNIYPDGVNIIGCINADSGLGQSCRLVANEVRHTNLPLAIYPYEPLGEVSQSDKSFDRYVKNACIYNINIMHINPRELGIAMVQFDKKIFDHRYNIGFWLWELEEFPEEWVPFINYFDEIWTPSEFISNSIRKRTAKPVVTIPYSIEVKTDGVWGRRDFNLPEETFLFLMMYDNNSISERKNPKGGIEAFKKAFGPEDTNVGLVIKVTSALKKDIDDLQHMLEGYKNVFFITDTLKKDKVNSLIQCVDVVVSLHRAEGFGLVMAEAMHLGTPTIATNWSSNTEFMNSDVACMVDYKLIEIEHNLGPFKKGQRWADPDVIQASHYMIKLYKDKDFYAKIQMNAKEHISHVLSMENIQTLIARRINEIYLK